jgi:2-dehydro-3-deoxyphosphogluconate aldolase / (4S)-4-hydroxy-2-oxoglutarate aldolase
VTRLEPSDAHTPVHGASGDGDQAGGAVFAEMFQRVPVMAILRGYDLERTVELACLAWDLGIVSVEIPVQSEASLEALAAVVAAATGRDVHVGAGTVTTVARVHQAARAGATFTVAPGFAVEVARASRANGLAHLPGVATPTDVHRALQEGCSWLKVFPAAALTPAWVRLLHGPFPQASFVATGGIDSTNAQSFLDAGCRGVAVGSALESDVELRALASLIRQRPDEPVHRSLSSDGRLVRGPDGL